MLKKENGVTFILLVVTMVVLVILGTAAAAAGKASADAGQDCGAQLPGGSRLYGRRSAGAAGPSAGRHREAPPGRHQCQPQNGSGVAPIQKLCEIILISSQRLVKQWN